MVKLTFVLVLTVCFSLVLSFGIDKIPRLHFDGINNSEVDTDQESLVMLQVFFRHADRAPTSTYPKDPYQGPMYWPNGFGQLTKVGKQHAFALGQYLRGMYNRFLGNTYRPQYVRARSTDFDRTLMTNMLVLAGIYPPQGDQVWNADIKWQPIPVHTVPAEEDWLAQETLCPVSKAGMKKALQEPELLQINEDNKELYASIQESTGMDIKDVSDIADVHGTLLSEQSAGIDLPAWTDAVFPDKTAPIAGKYFELYTSTDQLTTLIAGPLLREIKKNIDDKTAGGQKMLYTYGTHDKIIAAILGSLKIFDPILPGFASAIIIETHKLNDESYGVKFSYRNQTDGAAHTLQMPDCDVICPLEKFYYKINRFIPIDWDKQCGL